ncbi:hypothetical protein HDV04_002002 [Boothiomyces sp. JEL0838]|nr:hypothetical protein HDV04_002002 [Boothiomyces sp. JEL0838]
MLFLKPTSSFLQNGGKIEIPKNCDVHHELELGVIIGKTGRDIPLQEANSFVDGYVLALDMTARNVQDQAKKKGHPWTVAKGYDTFTPIGSFIPKENVKNPKNLQLILKVDEQVKQNGSTADMIFDIPTLIKHVSGIMTLEKGDLILTGTPSGVGPVSSGQTVHGLLKDNDTGKELSEIKFTVTDRK